MFSEVSKRDFANGTVYALRNAEGVIVETTDTFLPYETKFCTNGTNKLPSEDLGSREERWMIGVSTMSGCPVGCKFCATGNMPNCDLIHWSDIVNQVLFVLQKHPVGLPYYINAKELKINYTRMGEPFLNLPNVLEAITRLEEDFFKQYRKEPVHHLISTIGLTGSDFSWIEDNISLQISLHSLDENRRRELIPVPGLMTLEELGKIRTNSKQKTTLNLTLVDEEDFDIDKLVKYFDPEHFFIKLSPINPNAVSEANQLGLGVLGGETNLL